MRNFIRIIKAYWFVLFLIISWSISLLKGIKNNVVVSLGTIIITFITIIVTIYHDNNSALSSKKTEYLEKIIYSSNKYKHLVDSYLNQEIDNKYLLGENKIDLLASLGSNIKLLDMLKNITRSDYRDAKKNLDSLKDDYKSLSKLLNSLNDFTYSECSCIFENIEKLLDKIIKNCQEQIEKSPEGIY
ncbi:hypothetical protein [Lactobacillus sp. ESL0228]|uniref:hypothetical protein n=1 Tax=Lactobacillus sp. ESL0228 TaxID=2069352 RepID=UPI000EFB48A8|nr:hypothetical protein [Lactobacillus sp. ESL0228]RMC48914.1 hypothetical protein F5ESL0228_04800 [Lactobacillus sp. ESL0228]